MKKECYFSVLLMCLHMVVSAQTNCSYSEGMFNGCESAVSSATLSVAQEYIGSGANTMPQGLDSDLALSDLGGDEYKLCSSRLRSLRLSQSQGDPDCSIHSNIDATPATSSDPQEDMVYYYLDMAWDHYTNSAWNEVGSLPDFIEFKSRDLSNDLTPTINVVTANPSMLEYGYSTSNYYHPLAEDAYAIINGFFQYIHETEVGTNDNRATSQGVDFALGNYFAYRMLQGTDSDNGNEFIFERGGTMNLSGGSRLYEPITMNIGNVNLEGNSSLSSYYESEFFKFEINSRKQKQSELLSATLWELGNVEIGLGKVDNLIIKSLNQMSTSNISTQVDAVIRMYDYAAQNLNDVNPGELEYTSNDLCAMIDLFSRVYGESFYSKLIAIDENGASLHYVPDTNGDIYIRDDADDEGVEPQDIGSVFNSVDLWNRHEDNNNNGMHQNPIANLGSSGTNYLKIRINGRFCETATAASNNSDLINYKLEIYRTQYNVCGPDPDPNPNWPSSFIAPYLLGTYNFGNGELTTPSNVSTGNLSFHGDHAIITCPWLTPSWPYPSKCEIDNGAISFLARLVDEETIVDDQFDPISYEPIVGTVIPASQYAYQNNNVAFKRSMVMHPFPTASGPSVTPTHGVVMPGGDPDDEIIISIFPSIPTIHGSDEDLEDIGTPDFGEDYTDYGDVAIVLDDDTFADWIAGGAQGGGFTITQDQEIMITTPEGFFLGGIPASTVDDIRFAEIRYLAAPNFKPVAFDIKLTKQSDATILDQIHVEVWHDTSQNQIRSSDTETVLLDDIILSPNPAREGVVHISLDNTSEIKTIVVYDIQGKLQLQQEASGNSAQLDISNVNNGLYIVRITDVNGTVYTKKGMKL